MNRKVKLIFTLSLVLNVFLTGALAGVVIERLDPPFSERAELAPESRQLVQKQVSDTIAESREIMRETRDSRREMFDALSGEEIDVATYQQAAEKMIEAHGSLLRLRSEKTLEMAQSLTQQEREKLARHMMAPGHFADRFGMRKDSGRRHFERR